MNMVSYLCLGSAARIALSASAHSLLSDKPRCTPEHSLALPRDVAKLRWGLCSEENIACLQLTQPRHTQGSITISSSATLNLLWCAYGCRIVGSCAAAATRRQRYNATKSIRRNVDGVRIHFSYVLQSYISLQHTLIDLLRTWTVFLFTHDPSAILNIVSTRGKVVAGDQGNVSVDVSIIDGQMNYALTSL